jgi:hypothetical protein
LVYWGGFLGGGGGGRLVRIYTAHRLSFFVVPTGFGWRRASRQWTLEVEGLEALWWSGLVWSGLVWPWFAVPAVPVLADFKKCLFWTFDVCLSGCVARLRRIKRTV